MKQKFLLIIVLTSLASPVEAQLYVPDPALRAEIQVCQNLEPDLAEVDSCLYALAQEKQVKVICNYIHNNHQHLQCHRSMPGSTWDSAGFLQALPMVAFFLILIGLLVLRPPRGPYVTGMIVGAFMGLLLIYLMSMPFEWLRSVQPYLPYLATPVDGLMRFSPPAFSLWPFAVKFVAAHVIVYGAGLGSFLHGQENRAIGVYLLLTAMLLTFWDHPLLRVITDRISM